jgi:hypothetical protein
LKAIIKLTVFTLTILICATAIADTLKDEKAMRQLSDSVMGKVASGDFMGAITVMKPYSPLSEAEMDSIALQTKAKRDQYKERYGTTIGYEFIDQKKVGESLYRLQYIEKKDKHAIAWTFLFYKANDAWILNEFKWSDQPARLFY